MSGKQNEWTDVQKKAFEIITSVMTIMKIQGQLNNKQNHNITT